MSGIQRDAQKIIEELRAKRAVMGDTTPVEPTRIEPRRVVRTTYTRPRRWRRDAVLVLYAFVAGLLLPSVLKGFLPVMLIFVVLIGLLLWTMFKE